MPPKNPAAELSQPNRPTVVFVAVNPEGQEVGRSVPEVVAVIELLAGSQPDAKRLPVSTTVRASA